MNFLYNKNPGVNMDVINNKGETPLHLAIEYENISMIKLLLYLKASLKPINFNGKSPLDLLNEKNLTSLIHPPTSECAKSEGMTSYRPGSQIKIRDVTNDDIDGMFDNIRNYFRKAGVLSPKLNTESVEMKESSVHSPDQIKFKASFTTESDD